MCKKQNDLSISRGNHSNPDVIESKTVNEIVRRSEQKHAGGKYEGFSHYVIENIGSEIAVFELAIMLMKNKVVSTMASISPLNTVVWLHHCSKCRRALCAAQPITRGGGAFPLALFPK
jgi:hypothetical protein